MDGHTVVVGALFDDTGPSKLEQNAGSAHVYLFGVLSDITATIDHVAGLYRQDVLDAGQADALIANLEVVAEALDRDDGVAALDRLRAFMNQVDAFINARILSPAEGRTLIDQANDIIGFVRR